MGTNEERERFFESIYTKYYKKLENICLLYVNYSEDFRALIDESIQDTFLTAVEQYEALCKHPAIEGWLVQTCYNRFTTAVRKYQRRKKRHAYAIDDAVHAPPLQQTVDSIDAWMDEAMASEYVTRIIAALNDREIQVYHDYFVGQHKISEIADEQNTTISAVKSIIARVRKKARNVKNTDLIIMFLFSASFPFVMRLMK